MRDNDEKMTMEEWLDTGEGVAHQIWHERARALTETIWAMAGALLADGLVYIDVEQWSRPLEKAIVTKNGKRYASYIGSPQQVINYWNTYDIFVTVAAMLTNDQTAEVERVRFTLPIVEELVMRKHFCAARAYERNTNVNIKLYCRSLSLWEDNKDSSENFNNYLYALFDVPYPSKVMLLGPEAYSRHYKRGGIYAPAPGRVAWPRLISPFENGEVITMDMLEPHSMQFSPYMPLSSEFRSTPGVFLSSSDGFADVPKPTAKEDVPKPTVKEEPKGNVSDSVMADSFSSDSSSDGFFDDPWS